MNILDIAIAKKLAGGGGGSGTDNYNDLSNLPKINDTTLSGNKSSSALGLQSEINSDSKLASDLVDDTNQDNKFVTSTEKNTWNAKQNAIDADHKINADYVDDSTSTNKFVTASDKETWNAKQNAIDNSHKLSSDLVDDANHTNKFVTSTEKTTWNNKQNAIDADHKLSSSLVSFTTAEAAALASGIDSSKVGQISTNQTNILYTLKRTGENYLPVTSGTVNNGNIMKLEPVYIKAGYYTFSFKAATGFSGAYEIDFYQADGTTKYAVQGQVSSSVIRNFQLTNDMYYVTLYFSGAVTVSEVMVCHELRYNADNSFVDYSLPNYDLTRLEAEDRAALAEVVDSGSKNKFPYWTNLGYLKSKNTLGTWDGNIYTWRGVTFTVNDDGTIKVNGTASNDGNAYLSYGLFTTSEFAKYVGLVVSGTVTGTKTGVSIQYNGTPSYATVAQSVNGSSAVIPTLEGSVATYVILDSGKTASNEIISPMFCSEAEYKASSTFSPFALDNLTLTPVIQKYNVVTTTTEALYTELNVIVPKNCTYRITAYLGYNDSAPKSVTLSYSDDPTKYNLPRYILSTVSHQTGETHLNAQTSAIVIAGGNDSPIYVWASSMANGTNSLQLIVEKLGVSY